MLDFKMQKLDSLCAGKKHPLKAEILSNAVFVQSSLNFDEFLIECFQNNNPDTMAVLA